ncbi:MAG: NADH-quinone oxidoreductase subunit N, partial [Candidatus Sumerlaeaceae bacterium]|nr:NADH-quinone oxidoreductase subunit N [Candidatus Sumerlaeaceae bacterium]
VSSVPLVARVAETLRGLDALIPFLWLAAGALCVLVVDWFQPAEKSHRTSWAALLFLLGTLVGLTTLWGKTLQQPIKVGWDLLVFDPFALFFSLLFVVATFVVVGMSRSSKELEGRRLGEYYALLLSATLSACLLSASQNLLVLYLCFETLSLSSYVLAGYAKDRRAGVESALKYVLFGAVSSGMMLYGLSLAYGLVGSLNVADLVNLFTNSPATFLLIMVLLLAGFGFKMSLVPFHFWAPDVYQGAPTPVTAYLSVVSKAAGFAVFLRLLAPFVGLSLLIGQSEAHPPRVYLYGLLSLLWVVATLTMTLGNFVALKQSDFKRLLAYSSIAHAGYLAAAIVAHNRAAYEAVVFYFVVYAIANLGLFFAAQIVHAVKGTFEIDGFKGLVYHSPALAASVAILLWSLIGLPPSAGFMGKFYLFVALVKRGLASPFSAFYYSLLLIALANSVVSLYYYISVIKQMTFYRPSETVQPCQISAFARTALVAAAGLILGIQLYWQPLSDLAASAIGGRNTLAPPTEQHAPYTSHPQGKGLP